MFTQPSHPRSRNRLATFVSAAVLGLAGVAAEARDKADPVALDPSFNAAARADSLLQSTDPAAFKGLKRAAISSFQVEFVTKGSATATAREFGKSGSANSSMSISLTGVDERDFQAITDQLYAEFVRDLQRIGVEVLPPERVLAAEAYRKMAATGNPAPYRKSGGGQTSVVMAPQGLAIYGITQSAPGNSLFGALSALSTVASAFGTITGSVDLQKELDASLLQVRMVLNFADMSTSSSSFLGRMSGEASVQAKISPTIQPTQTLLYVQSATGGSSLTLRVPLTLPGDAIREVKDVTSTGGAVALALFAAAIGQSASASEKEAVADPAQYRSTVAAGFGSVREMMIERLTRER